VSSPALVNYCGHKATKTSPVPECLPALEALQLRGDVLEFTVHHPHSEGKARWEQHMWSGPTVFRPSSFKGTTLPFGKAGKAGP
jgi:hypothetical protein